MSSIVLDIIYILKRYLFRTNILLYTAIARHTHFYRDTLSAIRCPGKNKNNKERMPFLN